MLAPSWPFTTNTQYAQYIPPRPSPLSPRSANVLSPRKAWGRDTMSKQSPVDQYSKPVPQSSSSSLVSQKSSFGATKTRKNAPPAFALRGGAKPNPLMRKEGDQRERRRDLFMKKVQTGREDKRWEGRSEQVQYHPYSLTPGRYPKTDTLCCRSYAQITSSNNAVGRTNAPVPRPTSISMRMKMKMKHPLPQWDY